MSITKQIGLSVSNPVSFVSSEPSHPSILLKHRINKFIEKFKLFQSQLSIPQKIQIKFESKDNPRTTIKQSKNINFSLSSPFLFLSTKKRKQAISFPFWYLLKYKDIPENFRKVDLTNPQRVMINKLSKKLALWMQSKAKQMGILFNPPFQGSEVSELIWHLQNKQTFKKGKDFTIAHELSHLIKENYPDVDQAKIASLKKTFTAALILLSFSLIVIPFIDSTLGLSITAIALCIAGISLMTLRIKIQKAHRAERNCDLSAAKILGSGKWGAHAFEATRQYHLFLRKNQIKGFDVKGNDTQDNHHPLLTTRISYLTNS